MHDLYDKLYSIWGATPIALLGILCNYFLRCWKTSHINYCHKLLSLIGSNWKLQKQPSMTPSLTSSLVATGGQHEDVARAIQWLELWWCLGRMLRLREHSDLLSGVKAIEDSWKLETFHPKTIVSLHGAIPQKFLLADEFSVLDRIMKSMIMSVPVIDQKIPYSKSENTWS